MTTLVKVCGITTPADARAAADAGADMLGVNLWPGSSRFVSRETARVIRDAVNGGPTLVALFVDSDARQITEALAETGIAHAQLHGPVPDGLAPFIRATTPDASEDAQADWLLLDAHVSGQRGGTGQSFDWTLARPFAAGRRVMLAGGLKPANVAEAIATSGAQAVDVCSGVEQAPGVKDHAALRAFVAAARSINQKPSLRGAEGIACPERLPQAGSRRAAIHLRTSAPAITAGDGLLRSARNDGGVQQ